MDDESGGNCRWVDGGKGRECEGIGNALCGDNERAGRLGGAETEHEGEGVGNSLLGDIDEQAYRFHRSGT